MSWEIAGRFAAIMIGLLISSFGACLLWFAWLEGEPGKGFAPGWGDFEEVLDPALVVVGFVICVFGVVVIFATSVAGRQ